MGIAELAVDLAIVLAEESGQICSQTTTDSRHGHVPQDLTYFVESALCRADTENLLPEKLIKLTDLDYPLLSA